MNELVSLKVLIDENRITAKVLSLIQRDLVDILMLRQDEDGELPCVCAENIVFDANFKEVVIIDNVGCGGNDEDIYNYGEVLKMVLAVLPIKQRRLEMVAEKCLSHEYNCVQEIELAIEKRISNNIYIPLIVIIAVLMGILALLNRG